MEDFVGANFYSLHALADGKTQYILYNKTTK